MFIFSKNKLFLIDIFIFSILIIVVVESVYKCIKLVLYFQHQPIVKKLLLIPRVFYVDKESELIILSTSSLND